MKAGYCLGIDWDNRKIVTASEFLMMEDFMSLKSIKNPSDVICYETKTEQIAWKDCLVKGLLKLINGSDNPLVSTAARNTGLFAPHGPAVGEVDVCSKVTGNELKEMLGVNSLMELIYKIQN